MKNVGVLVVSVLVGIGVAALSLFGARRKPIDPSDLLLTDSLLPTSTPPSIINLPLGWRRVTSTKEIPNDAIYAASQFLFSSSMGQFEAHDTWGLIKEWHFDDHVSPGQRKWHPGVTVLLPLVVTT